MLKSPAISTVHRRTTEAQGRWRRNPAAANSKGKEPVAVILDVLMLALLVAKGFRVVI